LVDNGYNVLVGSNSSRILESVNAFSSSELTWGAALYGDGKAGNKIVDAMTKHLI
jgi:UDP-N-acetylglucosamine 2-epimerase